MKKMMIGLVGMATVMFAAPETMAAPHGHKHDRGNDGLRLAAGIVHLVKEVVAPTPAVVTPRPIVVAPPPAVVTPRPIVVTPRRPAVKAPARHHRVEPKRAPQKHDRAPRHNNKKGNRR